jgi:hypothetical protein
MGKLCILGLAAALTAGIVATATSQGQDDKKDKKGPPPKGFELGKVLPPHVMEELDLTEEQHKQLRELEKETRKKLEKILTEKQLEKVKQLGKRPPRDKGKDGDEPPPPPDKGKDKGPPKGKDKGKGPPKDREKDDQVAARQDKGQGIAWFATWQDGLKEAKRTGKPILLVSAAPHCAGVSGTW